MGYQPTNKKPLEQNPPQGGRGMYDNVYIDWSRWKPSLPDRGVSWETGEPLTTTLWEDLHFANECEMLVEYEQC